MPPLRTSNRARFDRAGIALSAFCAVHCVLGLIIVSLLGIGSTSLGSPLIHEIGLAIAVPLATVSLGLGYFHHRRSGPLALGLVGLVAMALALAAPHGFGEALLTLVGVAAVAIAHLGNLRRAR